MGRGKSGHSSECPHCGTTSTCVHSYHTRSLLHYGIGGMEKKEYPTITFRCVNALCEKERFVYFIPVEGLEEVEKGSRYTKSSKSYIAKKLLKRQVSYNSMQAEIKEDFGGKTSISTLHTWTHQMKVVDVETEIESVEVLHTDEKHPAKKKKK